MFPTKALFLTTTLPHLTPTHANINLSTGNPPPNKVTTRQNKDKNLVASPHRVSTNKNNLNVENANKHANNNKNEHNNYKNDRKNKNDKQKIIYPEQSIRANTPKQHKLTIKEIEKINSNNLKQQKIDEKNNEGEHLIDVVKELVLSSFPNHGIGVSLNDEHLDEQFRMLNLQSVKPRLNTTLNDKSVSDVDKFVDKVFSCVKSNSNLLTFSGNFWKDSMLKNNLFLKNHVSNPKGFEDFVMKTSPGNIDENVGNKNVENYNQKSTFSKNYNLKNYNKKTNVFSDTENLVQLKSDQRKENIRHAFSNF